MRTAACVGYGAYATIAPTLACWHGATPGAVVGAGPRDIVVFSDHHITRLAHKRHILAHCYFITDSKSIRWNTRVTTGDHCPQWSNKMYIRIHHEWCC